MFKMLVMFSPLILRTCAFSSGRITEHINQTKSKLLNKAAVMSHSKIQNQLFSNTTPSVTIGEVDYEQLKEIISQNKALIIDVRTRQELAETGVLPNSLNIPLDELNSAFQLTNDQFLEKYHVYKPNENQTIVFSCAKGIRSLIACNRLLTLGYTNLFNYVEGWYGWESHK